VPFGATSECGRSGQSQGLPSSARFVAPSGAPGPPRVPLVPPVRAGTSRSEPAAPERGVEARARRCRPSRVAHRGVLAADPVITSRTEARHTVTARSPAGPCGDSTLAVKPRRRSSAVTDGFRATRSSTHGEVSRRLPWGSLPLGEVDAVIVASVYLTDTFRSRSFTLPQRFDPTGIS